MNFLRSIHGVTESNQTGSNHQTIYRFGSSCQRCNLNWIRDVEKELVVSTSHRLMSRSGHNCPAQLELCCNKTAENAASSYDQKSLTR
jgi:hypothetical protein